MKDTQSDSSSETRSNIETLTLISILKKVANGKMTEISAKDKINQLITELLTLNQNQYSHSESEFLFHHTGLAPQNEPAAIYGQGYCDSLTDVQNNFKNSPIFK